ncbi:MAG: globin domain-containing protein [Candidatus Manganitrophus sp.]|nr:globin domain-containing protein [Candidatus Manganitrophus sp.]MDC4225557.1 globin domain-containing protein [Candidatus Manganitrophus sp.]WDT73086.1 MAG: globin domain-containing protein [Candidatus Manganitrophus sp.]WDT79381.1 MAG: globin domain-containing protein [Candidatus Manganitrophus sp.]
MSEVTRSFNRVRNDGLAERFYEILLEADPRIRPLFNNTDFKRQRDLLIHAIVMLIEYADGKPLGEMAIRRLGELHSRRKMNVTPDLYPIWADAMIDALAQLDPEFSPDLGQKWRNVMQKGIAVMLQMN